MTSPNEAFLRTLPEFRRAKHEAQESTRALERIVTRMEIQLSQPDPDLVDLAHETAEALRGHQPGLSRRMWETATLLHQRTKARPKIVCLCGSTRFYEVWQQANFDETCAGNIILSVGFYPHAEDKAHAAHVGITPEQKVALDELHKRKIDLADEVYVLNVGGYVGDSTRSEIEYARAHGKPVRWLEPDKAI